MNTPSDIGQLEAFVGLRLAGLSMTEVARELDVTPTHIKNVMAGKSKSKRVSEYINKNSRRVKIILLDE
jgi:hypothetical protein